jgi:transposase InsO family protein
MATELVLDALMMAVWGRRPMTPVMIHSDQGKQFGSDDFNRWCKENRLVPSMSRGGNCWAMLLPNRSLPFGRRNELSGAFTQPVTKRSRTFALSAAPFSLPLSSN